jgi:hypothetical protein
MTLGHLWAGNAYGTNTGKLFVTFDGEDANLTGKLHFNDTDVGVVVYSLTGSFDGAKLELAGQPDGQPEGYGTLQAAATLNQRGQLEGQWATTIGTAGTFILFPHVQGQSAAGEAEATRDQLHTARYQFGAIQIDREQITGLADEIQRELKTAKVIVTVVGATEEARFLPDFKTLNFNTPRAVVLKLFGSEPEGTGVNRVISVEFGPQSNAAMTQGGDEAWVLGMMERLKRSVRPFERSYPTTFKRVGIGLNQLLLLGSIVVLPSLASLRERAVLMGGVLALIFALDWLNRRYVPLAAIYLTKKPVGFGSRIAPSLISWIIALTAGAAAVLLASYLQGWLDKP